MGGVRETIGNYLQCFSTPDIAEVFCAVGKSNTFEFSDVDHGKIICVSMPQKYQMERRYVNTFLKMLFYTHVLRRFDKTKDERADDNLLILWADEAQRFVTAAEDGMSDFNSVDVIREARATLVAAAQSSTSFIPPLGNDKAKVLTLNLRNRIIFKSATRWEPLKALISWAEKSHQAELGIFKRHDDAQLLRARGAQNQGLRIAGHEKAPMRPQPLRKGVQKIRSSTFGNRTEKISSWYKRNWF